MENLWIKPKTKPVADLEDDQGRQQLTHLSSCTFIFVRWQNPSQLFLRRLLLLVMGLWRGCGVVVWWAVCRLSGLLLIVVVLISHVWRFLPHKHTARSVVVVVIVEVVAHRICRCGSLSVGRFGAVTNFAVPVSVSLSLFSFQHPSNSGRPYVLCPVGTLGVFTVVTSNCRPGSCFLVACIDQSKRTVLLKLLKQLLYVFYV